MPVGTMRAWGLPFDFTAPGDALIPAGMTVRRPVGGQARWIVLATACDTALSRPDGPADRRDDDHLRAELDAVGETVAEVVLHRDDGSTWSFPLRRRFETAPPYVQWGQQPFIARGHVEPEVVPADGPHEVDRWGADQMAVRDRDIDGPRYWLAAIELPEATRSIAAIEVTATGAPLLLGALTMWNGCEWPMGARRDMHVHLDGIVDPDSIEVVDGTLIRVEACDPPAPETWNGPGLSGFGAAVEPSRRHVVLVASAARTRIIADGQAFEVDPLAEGEPVTAGLRSPPVC